MDEALENFLSGLSPRLIESRGWGEGLAFRASCYVHDVLPPEEFVTSARAIVLTDSGIALVHNPDGFHILPGGRREPGESLLETLSREVREETGCEIGNPCLVGFIHFRHLTPRPEDYQYPYPDFLQVVYAARARRTDTESIDPDGWEVKVELMAPAEARRLKLSDAFMKQTLVPSEDLYLEEALRILEAA